MQIAVVGSRDITFGFRLAGVSLAYHVEKGEEAKEVIEKLVKEKEAAVILVGESVALPIIDYIEEVSSTVVTPSILVIRDEKPGKNIGGRAISRYIERATGIPSLGGE